MTVQTKREVLHARQKAEYQKRVPKLRCREPDPVFVRYWKDHTGEIRCHFRRPAPAFLRDANPGLTTKCPKGYVIHGSLDEDRMRAETEASPTPPIPYELTDEYRQKRAEEERLVAERVARRERLEAGDVVETAPEPVDDTLDLDDLAADLAEEDRRQVELAAGKAGIQSEPVAVAPKADTGGLKVKAFQASRRPLWSGKRR